ncbi:MAG TPA: 50S ribosomal protein L13 [Firmicutes bacterium]|nr:50S ribosomal protein L13 [Bacillota bacterium]
MRGDTKLSKTYTARPADIVRQWYVVDAKGKTLGRLATKIASVLKGKHKVIYTPHMDVGDHVIVINAKDVVLTGNKREKKVYYRHTGYPGGLKKVTAAEMLEKNPERVVKAAVWGMLPHNRLGRKMFRKLKVYAGPEHPHQAQQPKELEI